MNAWRWECKRGEGREGRRPMNAWRWEYKRGEGREGWRPMNAWRWECKRGEGREGRRPMNAWKWWGERGMLGRDAWEGCLEGSEGANAIGTKHCEGGPRPTHARQS
jgi:hypothetical protein